MPRLSHILLVAGLFVALAPMVSAIPGDTEWNSEALNLRFSYLSSLVSADPSTAIRDGNLTLLVVSAASDSQLADATHCLRPTLLLQAPASAPDTATILLAELDVDCLTPEEQVNSKNLLATMAEAVTKVPGMKSIAQPNWYNIGWQKVHMAAAQGNPHTRQTAQGANPPQPLFAMGISTIWNNHLLVWYFSSNNIGTLNRITKATVRFGRSAAAPLYPLTMGNGTPSAQ